MKRAVSPESPKNTGHKILGGLIGTVCRHLKPNITSHPSLTQSNPSVARPDVVAASLLTFTSIGKLLKLPNR